MNPPTLSTLTRLLTLLALLGSAHLASTAADPATPTRRVLTSAQGITLPRFKLEGVSIAEAVSTLQAAGKRHDPKRTGVNYILTDAAKTKASSKITLDLRNVAVAEATERLAQAAGLRVSAEDYAFVLNAQTDKP